MKQRNLGVNHESMKCLAVSNIQNIRNEVLRSSVPAMTRGNFDDRSQGSGPRSTCDNTIGVSGKGMSLMSKKQLEGRQNASVAGGDSASPSPQRRQLGTSHVPRRSRAVNLHSMDGGFGAGGIE
jgi:hypothetical protein